MFWDRAPMELWFPEVHGPVLEIDPGKTAKQRGKILGKHK